MCGIAGVVGLARGHSVSQETLQEFVRALAHRGPDASGVWRSGCGAVGLAHTRLAIIDPTDDGGQPMVSADGRWVIVYNGEIYNYTELRSAMEQRGHRFRSHCDTEVLLELFAERGVDCLRQLDGMFAFAAYDTRERALFLVRDPLGEKPVYVARTRFGFAFASEVRALIASGLVDASLDLRGIGLFLRQGSIPAPYTHVRNVELLAPGSWLKVEADGREACRKYWWPEMTPERSACTDYETAIRRLRSALIESTRRRLRSDVPLALLLSGGVDSKAVAALAVQAGVRGIESFTVTLPGQAGDEADRAAAVAKHLNLSHHELPLQAGDETAWVDEAIDAMDVPSVDGPNTWLITRAVRQAGLKVALSGLGGDELFFGYPSFRVVPQAARLLRPLRSLRAARGLTRPIMQRLPGVHGWSRAMDAALAGGSVAALWLAKRGVYSAHELHELLHESVRAEATLCDAIDRIEDLPMPRDVSVERQVSWLELSVYLHDQLLRDSDAASMAHGVEVRFPLISREVVDLASTFATSLLKGKPMKRLLRDAVRPFVPEPVRFTRVPKQGFTLNWMDLLGARAGDAERTLAGLLSAGAYERERHRFARTHRGFARVYSLEVLGRKLEQPLNEPGSQLRLDAAQPAAGSSAGTGTVACGSHARKSA